MKNRCQVFPLVAVTLTCGVVGQTFGQPPCMFAAQDHIENPLGFGNQGVADAEIAVGTERILTCSNSWLRLLDKSGQPALPPQIRQARLGEYDPGSLPYPFFFPLTAPQNPQLPPVIGDPMVYFDYEEERFWVVAIEGRQDQGQPIPFDHSIAHIAVSTSATPGDWVSLVSGGIQLGSWWKYNYCLWTKPPLTGCSNIHGFGHNPTMAVDGDTLYIAFLDDEGQNGRSTTLMMVDKDALMAGTQATPVYLRLGDPPYNEDTWGHAIAVEYDAWNNSDPVYTVASSRPPSFPGGPKHQDTILVGAIVPNGSTFDYVSFPLTGNDLPAWFDNAGSSPAPSGAGAVSVIGRTFLHATYRPDDKVGGRIWTCAHIRETTGGSGPNDPPQPVGGNFVRYYEIHTNGWPNSTNTPTLAYYGDIKFEGLDTYDPSIAVNAAGHIAISWTQSGPNLYPEFWMGVQRSFDPPGVLGHTQRIQSSTATRTVDVGHKADYSGTDPDPNNLCLFWGHSMLAESTSNWDSHVGVLCIPDCDADSYADQDGNQEYDAFDVLIFSERFRAGDPRADCNGDRVLDVLDYICFNSLFSAGGRR